MKLEEVSGDLFSAPSVFSFAHCVSADLKMGRGIAKEFKGRYGSIPVLVSQHPSTGNVVFLYDSLLERYIFYLVTKDVYYNKPTYESLRSSLYNLKNIISHLGVRLLAIPRIGCDVVWINLIGLG